MKKKLVGGFIALTFVIGTGVAVTMTSSDAHACGNCKVKGKSAPKRECGACNKKGMTKTSSEFKDGYWHVTYKCDHCSHKTVVKTKNMNEI